MNVAEFIAKWCRSELRESQGAQSHFNDLCRLLGQDEPATADPVGDWFCFERGATKQSGGDGWADVWKKGFFGWEYKGKHKDLNAAYEQLLEYRKELENPPLLIVSDMDQIIVRTNFTNTMEMKFEVNLANLDQPRSLEILRWAFTDPDKLKPGTGSRVITEEAAGLIAQIAQSLRDRGAPPPDVAHFLDRIVFCLFAEDVGLLPARLFTRILENTKDKPTVFFKSMQTLFEAMAHGGLFGADSVSHFNGNLFDSTAVLEMTPAEIQTVLKAALLDWAAVDPSIFGTLFERGLDPDKRSQLGAHYTSREDINTLVDPVVMTPLRREWEAVRTKIENLPNPQNKPQVAKKNRLDGIGMVRTFLMRLSSVKVLDPACGSGNFLYVTLQKLKDLEKEVILFANRHLGESFFPMVGPWQMYGIEINSYAHDLAQMTIWIGYLQWTRANGFGVTQDPILRTLDNFKCMDAILDLSDPEHPKEPEWPTVEFIVGNPPFLGGSKMWEELGRDYQHKLWGLYEGRVPGFADLCCYWFEKARKQIERGLCQGAGLLGTQAIRGGVNRDVLKQIKKTGDIFFAVSDRDWVLDGANVHVSMIGFDGGVEKLKVLDGNQVTTINTNLSSSADIVQAKPLVENIGISYSGTKKAGEFNVAEAIAIDWLLKPNPHTKPNSDLLRPWLNGSSIVQKPTNQWIIDTGTSMTMDEFCLYEEPFDHAKIVIKPARDKNKREHRKQNWWLHAETAPGMRAALNGCGRYVATPRVSKYRIFNWVHEIVLCDDGVFVFARSDDYFFGVLHSRLHETWARAQGTQVRERESGFRYTPTSCFETFPFPHPTPEQEAAIAAAAKELDNLRRGWLNPVEWTREEVLEFPGSADGPWARYVHDPDARGIGTVRWPRIVAKDEQSAKLLAKRTLTNLYNQRTAWLDLAHKKLDAAVFAAYAWPDNLTDEEILEKLLALNLERAGK